MPLLASPDTLIPLALAAGLGLLLGLLPWLWSRAARARAEAELAQRLESRDAEVERLTRELDGHRDTADRLGAEMQRLREQQAAQQSRAEAELKAADDKLKLLESAREQMTAQFRQLSAEILDEKSKRLGETSREGLKQILDPLREKIAGFEKQVADSYDRESKDRRALYEQVRTLQELSLIHI